MKKPRNWSFRAKLLIVNLGIVLLIVVGITSILTFTASERAANSHTASLNLLTEQAMINFTNRVDSIRQHLYTMSTSTGTPQQMAQLRALDAGSNAYLQARQELILALSRMVDSTAPYDHISVRLDNGLCVSSNTYDLPIQQEAENLLGSEEYSGNMYGGNTWVRTASGSLYLIRDVYSTQPLRHVGRIAARIVQDSFISLGQSNVTLHCALAFFDERNTLVATAGEWMDGMESAAQDIISDADSHAASGDYAVCLYTQDGWNAVGLLPKAVVNDVQNAVIRSSGVVAILGLLFGLIVTIAFSHRQTRQISRLVRSMNQVATGDLDVKLPVESEDEIGVLTRHFNNMTQKTSELLKQVVREENNKRQAEYQNLEYEYRFLQWQINPHFIYNALETVNGLAKLDGNRELCDMIVSLSAYFRQNAETMRKRFVTVEREFRSLKQYVDIYRHIYGDTFDVEISTQHDAARKYLPTMIIQPLLENALVHGIDGTKRSVIQITGDVEADKLVVRIRDDGSGMPEETIRRILTPSDMEGPHSYAERSSLGVRNVLDRMRLLYGSAASMHIESVLDEGTCVEILLPLCDTEQPDALRAGLS